MKNEKLKRRFYTSIKTVAADKMRAYRLRQGYGGWARGFAYGGWRSGLGTQDSARPCVALTRLSWGIIGHPSRGFDFSGCAGVYQFFGS
jgi:hypothetical protein